METSDPTLSRSAEPTTPPPPALTNRLAKPETLGGVRDYFAVQIAQDAAQNALWPAPDPFAP